jgi:hypothetical protein
VYDPITVLQPVEPDTRLVAASNPISGESANIFPLKFFSMEPINFHFPFSASVGFTWGAFDLQLNNTNAAKTNKQSCFMIGVFKTKMMGLKIR